jgi:hypothetical protein
MATERSQVRIYQDGSEGWQYPADIAAKLGWNAKALQVRALPKTATAPSGN